MDFKQIAMDTFGIKSDPKPQPDPADADAALVKGTRVDDVDGTLAERGLRYGKFTDNSFVYMQLMGIIHSSPACRQNRLSPAAYHALGNISTKLARLLTGDPNYDDNWRDIAGYATLMVRICNGEER